MGNRFHMVTVELAMLQRSLHAHAHKTHLADHDKHLLISRVLVES